MGVQITRHEISFFHKQCYPRFPIEIKLVKQYYGCPDYFRIKFAMGVQITFPGNFYMGVQIKFIQIKFYNC